VIGIIVFTKVASVLAKPLLSKAFSESLIKLNQDGGEKDLVKVLFGSSGTSESKAYASKNNASKVGKLFTKTLINSKKLRIILNLNTSSKYCALYVSQLEAVTYLEMFGVKNGNVTILTLEKEHEQKLFKLCQKDDAQIIQLSTMLSKYTV
jgi:hypothetical protein